MQITENVHRKKYGQICQKHDTQIAKLGLFELRYSHITTESRNETDPTLQQDITTTNSKVFRETTDSVNGSFYADDTHFTRSI